METIGAEIKADKNYPPPPPLPKLNINSPSFSLSSSIFGLRNKGTNFFLYIILAAKYSMRKISKRVKNYLTGFHAKSKEEVDSP